MQQHVECYGDQILLDFSTHGEFLYIFSDVGLYFAWNYEQACQDFTNMPCAEFTALMNRKVHAKKTVRMI